METLELSTPSGWGWKKRASAPSSVNTATFFIDHTVNNAILSIVMCDFLFQWTCSFGLSWIWLMHNEKLCPRLYTLHSLSTPPWNWSLKLQVCAAHSSVFFFESFCIRWTLTTSAFVVHHVQTWKAWDRICQMMVQVIFCQDNFSKYFIFSILDDGVLSHKEFVVVMKNQLVRGLENVIIFVY